MKESSVVYLCYLSAGGGIVFEGDEQWIYVFSIYSGSDCWGSVAALDYICFPLVDSCCVFLLLYAILLSQPESCERFNAIEAKKVGSFYFFLN